MKSSVTSGSAVSTQQSKPLCCQWAVGRPGEPGPPRQECQEPGTRSLNPLGGFGCGMVDGGANERAVLLCGA